MQGSLPDLRQLVPQLQGQGSALAMTLADAVRPYAPVDKSPNPSRPPGTLRDSLTGRAEAVSDGVTITIESADPVATYVIEGTSPHEIVARNAGSLRWESADGGVRFAKRVQHPGTAPNPFGDEAEGDIASAVEDAVDQAVAAVLT